MALKFFRYFLRIPLPSAPLTKFQPEMLKLIKERVFLHPLFHFTFFRSEFCKRSRQQRNSPIVPVEILLRMQLALPIVCRETYYYNPNSISCQTALFQFHFMFAIFQLFRSDFCKRSKCQRNYLLIPVGIPLRKVAGFAYCV